MSKYMIGEIVDWYLGKSIITSIDEENGKYMYNFKHLMHDLPGRASEESLDEIKEKGTSKLYEIKYPSVLIVDNFYKNPDKIRQTALSLQFGDDLRHYKGKRSHTRFLLPGLKEDFEKLLGRKITRWLEHRANGVFQITKYTDPLVWHSDQQSYAAAIYLTPHAPAGAGTSFWKDIKYGCRHPPFHSSEYNRFENDNQRLEAQKEIYSEYNLLHGDNWELVDRVGAIYNRLVFWDAKMIHSASSYESFITDEPNSEKDNSRLVQLFFFDIEQ